MAAEGSKLGLAAEKSEPESSKRGEWMIEPFSYGRGNGGALPNLSERRRGKQAALSAVCPYTTRSSAGRCEFGSGERSRKRMLSARIYEIEIPGKLIVNGKICNHINQALSGFSSMRKRTARDMLSIEWGNFST